MVPMMAKPNEIDYEAAKDGISLPKIWAGPPKIEWITNSPKCQLPGYSFRVSLEILGEIREGCFVNVTFKRSLISGIPDSVSFTLLFDNARILGIDDNGPSRHINIAGKGMPYYMQRIDHPHIHFPVPESSSKYAEPLEPQDISSLWNLFLEHANISGAPGFNQPTEQMGLPL